MSDYKSFTDIVIALGGASKLAAGIDEPPGRVQNWSQRNSMPSHAWWKTSQFAATRDIEVTVENMAQIADKQRDEK